MPWFARNILARSRVTIINYHDPEPHLLKKHLAYFVKCYHVISLDELSAAFDAGGLASLPARSLVVTFDDGHLGNRRLFDVLSENRVPFTIFAVAGVVGTRRRFWFKAGGMNGKAKARLKSLENKQRIRVLFSEYGFEETGELDAPCALSVEDLRRMGEIQGTVGAHSLFHPILPNCDTERLQRELVEAKAVLEGLLGRKVSHFAYPCGNWDERVRAEVVRAGYSTARTAEPGWVSDRSDRYTLPVMGIADDAGLNKAILQCSGVWWFFKRWLAMIRGRVVLDHANS